MIQSEACKQHGGKWIHSLIRGHSYAVPSTTPRRYRADHSLGRVLAHQCRQGLYRLRASLSVPPLFAARQRSATGGVGTLGTLQTLPDCQSDNPFSSSVGEVAGFSLHAGVATKANERTKLERLCRYITRPAVSTKRLTLTRNGQLRYELNQE
jgi:hypothetical protein